MEQGLGTVMLSLLPAHTAEVLFPGFAKFQDYPHIVPLAMAMDGAPASRYPERNLSPKSPPGMRMRALDQSTEGHE